MGDEPPSRSVEMEFMRAVLNSKTREEFITNAQEPLDLFSSTLEHVGGIKGRPQRIVPVESWVDVPLDKNRFWLPLSEIDPKRKVQYILSQAVEDVIRSPKRGPFYILTWELLLGTVVTSLRKEIPSGPLGTLFAGAIAAVSMTFDGIDNEISAMEYLDNLHSTASAALSNSIQSPEPNEPTLSDFYLRTAYQFTFDAISLWTSLVIKTVTSGFVEEKSLGKQVIDFLLSEPEINIGTFHIRGMDIARIIDYKRGKDLAEMAYTLIETVSTIASYPRIDDSESWRMFR